MSKCFFRKLSFLFFLFYAFGTQAQVSSIFDFQGQYHSGSFDAVISNGTLYFSTYYGGTNDFGTISKIVVDGSGYQVKHSFSSLSGNPYSLVVKDSLIYGTTTQGGEDGASSQLFRYNTKSGQFDSLTSFGYTIGQEFKLKYATDSVLWGYSATTASGGGCVFRINKDGSDFRKVFEFGSDATLGARPSDICIVDTTIYITCYAGGLYPYTMSDNSQVYSGCVVRVNTSGQHYKKVFDGKDQVGTQPASLVSYKGLVYGLFHRAGNKAYGGSLFKIDKEGDLTVLSSFESIGRGSLSVLNDTVWGTAFDKVFYFDIANSNLATLEEFDQNIGTDATVGPMLEGNSLFVITQQGGQYEEGAIVKMNRFLTITTSVNDLPQESSSLLLYPNPVVGDLSVEFKKSEFSTITFYDLQGRVVLEQSLEENKEKISVRHLKAGVYVAVLASVDKVETRKVIVK